MTKLAVAMSACLLAACAAPDPAEVRAPRSESEFVTGSRIPGKGPGATRTMSREELERARSNEHLPLPEGMKP